MCAAPCFVYVVYWLLLNVVCLLLLCSLSFDGCCLWFVVSCLLFVVCCMWFGVCCYFVVCWFIVC